MAEALRFGFAIRLACRRWTSRPKSAALLLVFGSSLLLQGSFVAAQSAQPPQAKKASPSASNPPAAEPQTPPPAQIWLPPLQAPAHTPVIAWDGKLLTIDADNSSLSDILLGIRSSTGASIEMPASTSHERIAAHLGPAPIREVISSLLYGTSFNYVIQSAEDDDSTLEKVILTARESDQGGDNAGDTVAGDGRTNPKVRLMPGYAAPGKRDFEVAHSNAVDDSASTVADTPAAESPSPTPDQTATAADSNAANQQDDPQPATAKATDSTSSGDTSTLTAADPAISGNAAGIVAGSSSGASSVGSGSTLSQLQQNMQRLYQQRQQLQAQQNARAGQTPAP